jgi:hypothetical protein
VLLDHLLSFEQVALVSTTQRFEYPHVKLVQLDTVLVLGCKGQIQQDIRNEFSPLRFAPGFGVVISEFSFNASSGSLKSLGWLALSSDML